MTIPVPAYLIVVAFLATPISALLGALMGAWITQRSRSGQPVIPSLTGRIKAKEPKPDTKPILLPHVGA